VATVGDEDDERDQEQPSSHPGRKLRAGIEPVKLVRGSAR